MEYDYLVHETQDVLDYIDENISLKDWNGRRDELEERLNDELWAEDSVTGNGSGSYTFSNFDAEENICHNMDLLQEAYGEFCPDKPVSEFLEEGAEAADVTIRCYLLREAISDALDKIGLE